MKRKICIFMVVFFLILLGIGLYRKHNVAHSDLYLEYQYPEEEFFGKELYSEIDHQSSPEELEFGKGILDKINQISSKLNNSVKNVKFNKDSVKSNNIIQNLTEFVNNKKDRLTEMQYQACMLV